jgi:hypothetical protein
MDGIRSSLGFEPRCRLIRNRCARSDASLVTVLEN